MWLSLVLGISSFLVIHNMPTGPGHSFVDSDTSFSMGVFISTGLSLAGMLLGSWLGPQEEEAKVDRFHVIMNTPIGDERRLIEAGIILPAMVDAGMVAEGPERIRSDVLSRLYQRDAQQKVFGPRSTVEIRREKLSWYLPGFILNVAACILLVVLTWLLTRICFIWT